jgi:hypothetical protein
MKFPRRDIPHIRKGGLPHHGHPVDFRWRRGERFRSVDDRTAHWEGALCLERREAIWHVGQIKTVRQLSIDLALFYRRTLKVPPPMASKDSVA